MKNIPLTQRQGEILERIVKTYIKSAEPVSSKFLEKKYAFGICPASIRIEMQKLTDKGYIFQPHTSAGRIPTDKGYRFFVDSLLKKEDSLEESLDAQIKEYLEEKITNSIKFIQLITRGLALISSNLALGYLSNEKIIWKDGWDKIVKEPEFAEKKNIDDFIKMIGFFEKEIAKLEDDLKNKIDDEEGKKACRQISSSIKVYIGKENPFPKAKEFSIIVTDYRLSYKEKGILALFGPKRMNYDKNIGSLNSLIKLLEKI